MAQIFGNMGSISLECPICLNFYTDHTPASEDYFVSTACSENSTVSSSDVKIGHVFHNQCLMKSLRFRLENEEPEEVDENYEFRREEARVCFNCPMCRNTNRITDLTRLYNVEIRERPADEVADHEIKIAILGKFKAGKTSIVKRFVNNVFDERYTSTVGVDFFTKTIQMGGKRVRLNLWDTAGQEEHRAVVTSFVRNAFGMVFVFDVTSSSSFAEINDWIKFANDHGPENTKRILVGNKVDKANRKVSPGDAKDLATRLNYSYIEGSAKDFFNISEIFRVLTADILNDKVTIMSADKVSEKVILHQKISKMKFSEKAKLLCCE